MRQIGRYRLDAVHGSGAFATVWRGFDTELETPVAVKVLAENWSHHADVRERFLAEARLLRRIQSDRVVRVHDVGVHESGVGGGQPYFVMDFIDGGTLTDVADGTLEVERALVLAAQAARGVEVVHAAGAVHRDVKPSNLLHAVEPDGRERVLVADLGSAKRLAEASGITVTTGTPSYMAPEQALGRPIDERSDVYALGVVTYELLTGTAPFDVSDPIALLHRTAADRPPATTGPRGIDDVLSRALALDPAQRYARAEDLAAAIEAVLDGSHVAHRNGAVRAWIVLVLTALAVFAAAAGATFWFLR